MKNHLVAAVAVGVVALIATTADFKAKSANLEPSQIGENLYFAGDSVQLNTHSDGRHVFVTGYVGESGPRNFIVDTGAGVNVIDRAIAEEMQLKKVGEKEVLSGGVEPLTVDIVVLPLVRVDGLSIKNAEFITLDLEAMSRGQFQGVLGMELFRETLLAFDPGNERITLSNGELSAVTPGVIRYNTNARSGFEINIDVAGQQVLMLFDTGAPSSFTFPLALSESLPLQGPLQAGPTARLVGGKRSIQLGVLDGVIKLGELAYTNPQVSFMDPSAPHGIIGNAVLQDAVLRIDQKNGLLALGKSESAKVAEVVVAKKTGKRRRLGIQFRGTPGGSLLTIARVDPGSLGEQAGIRAGDVLVRLNGQPAQEYDMKALGALFGGQKPLRFELDRDGEMHIIEIR